MVKHPLASAGDGGSIPGWKDLLEKGMATHSSILAWEIPQTEEPGGSRSKGSQESDMTEPTRKIFLIVFWVGHVQGYSRRSAKKHSTPFTH